MEQEDCIVILCHRRVSHLQLVLDSVKNSISVERFFIVFIVQDPIEPILNIINSFNLPKVIEIVDGTHYRSSAQAINGNLFRGLEIAFEELRSRRVIVLEDDIVLAADALEYFTRIFDSYESKREFRGVNAFSELVEHTNDSEGYVRVNFGLGWGWAINHKIYRRIRRTWSGKEDAHWDFCFEPYIRTGFVVNPIRSRINNIGFDETATHTSTDKDLGRRICRSFESAKDLSEFGATEKAIDFTWRGRNISLRQVSRFNMLSRKFLYLLFFFWGDSRTYHSVKRRLGLSNP